jgi:peptide chain release factor 1
MGYVSKLPGTSWSVALQIKRKCEELEKQSMQLSSQENVDTSEVIKIQKRLAEMSQTNSLATEVQNYRVNLTEIHAMIKPGQLPGASKEEKEMCAIAQEEAKEVIQRLMELEEELMDHLMPKDVDDQRNVILEVRPGTGGSEACIFALEIFGMYEKFAKNQGWQFEVVEIIPNGNEGCKEASANIKGHNVFRMMKYETGVHRVQRVPVTEVGGRVHTSAMTVAVLPEAEEVDVQIKEKDLKIDYYRASGAGGQHVNTTDSAVRITHIPTGTIVAIQDERSQHKNKAKAMKLLCSRVYEAQRRKIMMEREKTRSAQVGNGDRSERIRTYNFSQSRVTDHRIGMTVHDIDKFMSGVTLADMVLELKKSDQMAQLESLVFRDEEEEEIKAKKAEQDKAEQDSKKKGNWNGSAKKQ